MSSPASDAPAFADMALLTRGFQLSRMIQVAVALDLADHLEGGPQPMTALALKADADPAMLLRLCRALAAFGIFAVDAEGVVAQTARSDCLRRQATPTLYHAARYWATPHVWGGWEHLEDAVRTGGSAFESAYGTPKFEYLKLHPDEAELFDQFMQHGPDDRQAAVVAAYDFADAGLVVDVGGGNGALLGAILRANLEVRGVLFDQEAVVAGAARTLADVADRVQVEVGSFFEAVPSGGDVYTLSLILHDWDDERCLGILANIRTAMEAGKRLLVVERVLDQPDRPASPATYLSDINMMVNLHGRERTLPEFTSLLERSGFEKPLLHATESPFCILETISV